MLQQGHRRGKSSCITSLSRPASCRQLDSKHGLRRVSSALESSTTYFMLYVFASATHVAKHSPSSLHMPKSPTIKRDLSLAAHTASSHQPDSSGLVFLGGAHYPLQHRFILTDTRHEPYRHFACASPLRPEWTIGDLSSQPDLCVSPCHRGWTGKKEWMWGSYYSSLPG